MKRFKDIMNILLIIMILTLSLFVISCGDDKSNHNDPQERDDIDSELYFRNLFHDDIMLIRAEFNSEFGNTYGYFYYDKNGNMIAGPFHEIHPYIYGYATGDGRIIDTNGNYVTDDDVRVDSGNQYEGQYFYRMRLENSDNNLYGIIRYDGKQLTDFIYSSYFDFIKDDCLIGCKKPNGDFDFINIDGEIVNTYKAKGETYIEKGYKNYFFLKDTTDSDLYLTIFDFDCKKLNTICFHNCKSLTPYEIKKDRICVFAYNGSDRQSYIMDVNGERVNTPNNYSLCQVLRDDNNIAIILRDNDGKNYAYDEEFNKIINEEYDKIRVYLTNFHEQYLIGEKENLLYLYDASGKLLIPEGKEKITNYLNNKYTSNELFFGKEYENVIYAKNGNVNYFYDHNYNLLLEINDEELKKYYRFKVVYDDIIDKYYVCLTEIREKEGDYYHEYHSYCDIENNELIRHEFLETAYTTSYNVQDIVNGHLVYTEYDKTVIYDISKEREAIAIDVCCRCFFYDDYILFSKLNQFYVYDYNFQKICDFVVENPYDSMK